MYRASLISFVVGLNRYVYRSPRGDHSCLGLQQCLAKAVHWRLWSICSGIHNEESRQSVSAFALVGLAEDLLDLAENNARSYRSPRSIALARGVNALVKTENSGRNSIWFTARSYPPQRLIDVIYETYHSFFLRVQPPASSRSV